MSDDDSGEKTHEPSERRLEEAREKGEIPRSADLVSACASGGFALAGLTLGSAALRRGGDAGVALLSEADRLAPAMMLHGSAPLAGIMFGAGAAMAPFFLLPAGCALAALVALRGLVFAPTKLAMKPERISPLATAKQKFGRVGVIEFLKSFVKLLVTAAILGIFLLQRSDIIIATVALPPAQVAVVLVEQVLAFLLLVVLIAAVIGALDFLWQRHEHLRRHRMSRQDMLDEMKGAEGDPAMKAQRRQRGVEIAQNRMLVDVATADVVVVNPTHYAVALKWQRSDRNAPICVAKGTDEMAARIRERAAAAGVPMHQDAATARALHASVKIGEQIRPDHYRAVAAAIRFAEAMRSKARGLT